ncbi:hypothetical protein [Aestuariivivens sediminicola]|uniref:hypothetical protein n=1 Tax=Aestuariivivens sediminicola TaxID=2913560 RepID=UPI001F56308E|nr:hypothetical protein [Aestuariivivens sediminicola]
MKLVYALSLVFVLYSCKKEISSTSEIEKQELPTTAVTESDVSKIQYTEFVLSQESKALIENWTEYNQMQEQVGYIKKGDLSYFNDNEEAITKLLKDLTKNIPDSLNNNTILARLKIVETNMYKLESLKRLSTSTKAELLGGIKALLVAVSNLDLQLNKIVELKRNENIPKP